MSTQLTVRPAVDPIPPVKQAPTPLKSLKHIYQPSDDGSDENLLILLHGLGDTNVPFSKLGRQLHLPQTATLAVRAPEKVPYLYEEAYQWCESFDNFGELLARPNPSNVLELLGKLLDHLVQDCQWAPSKIHLFGFGQGGSIAVELGLRWWKSHWGSLHMRLGSIASIGGPLLSYPTPTSLCTTPVLVFHRLGSESTKLSSEDLTAFKRGYVNIQEVKGEDGEGIPRSKAEWEPIMKFWSTYLSKSDALGLYEVIGT